MPPPDLVMFRFQLPRTWRDELREAAKEQGLSMSALQRLITRNFLRNRYTEAEREALK